MTDIEYINRFSPYTLKLNEDAVFIFQIQIVDNDIDSDNEYFSDQAVYDMSRMFLGKTGFCGNSEARIFRTWVEPEKRKTKDGRNYTALYAKAYMIKTKENEDIRKEISAGIKKEVSLSCAVKKQICSICGTNRSKEQCNHKKGRECYYILDEVTDVYEWSFVMPTDEGMNNLEKDTFWRCEMSDDFIAWLYEQVRLYHCENYQFCINCPFYAIEVDSCAEMTEDQKREILMKIYESEVDTK